MRENESDTEGGRLTLEKRFDRMKIKIKMVCSNTRANLLNMLFPAKCEVKIIIIIVTTLLRVGDEENCQNGALKS